MPKLIFQKIEDLILALITACFTLYLMYHFSAQLSEFAADMTEGVSLSGVAIGAQDLYKAVMSVVDGAGGSGGGAGDKAGAGKRGGSRSAGDKHSQSSGDEEAEDKSSTDDEDEEAEDKSIVASVISSATDKLSITPSRQSSNHENQGANEREFSKILSDKFSVDTRTDVDTNSKNGGKDA